MRKPTRWILSLALLGAIGAAGFWGYRTMTRPEPTRYVTVEVTRGDVERSVSATGTLEAVNTVEVGSQVSGTIQAIYADYNSRVRKGQLIALIDPTLFLAEVEQYRGALLSAQGDARAAASDVESAARDAERNRVLFKKGYIAESDWDDARFALENARAKLAAARAKVAQARASLAQSERRLGFCRIVSPVDGVVVAKDVSAGQTVAASYQTPTLFTIAEDLTKMQVEANIDEADIGSVREGIQASFTVDAFPDDTFRGKIHQVRLQATTVENVVTYTVILRVDNPEGKLKPGMTADVTIPVDAATGVLRVPNAALSFSPKAEEGENGGNGAGVPAGQPGKNGKKGPRSGSWSGRERLLPRSAGCPWRRGSPTARSRPSRGTCGRGTRW
jgi:HlyD family secretion protein